MRGMDVQPCLEGFAHTCMNRGGSRKNTAADLGHCKLRCMLWVEWTPPMLRRRPLLGGWSWHMCIVEPKSLIL